ncbi:BfmA/BtgA family mobilization protein [Mesonia mobilis]|uniref:BfmA/BtgA family mobilization protein n=1 Tax=Mesonia mobilis TaxID=369791 RepID=UPI0003FFE6E1|nr:BfmA/BtgA family mobilization protein [Mesonia mobilis]
MEPKPFKKYKFSAINFKKEVADQFRIFSKKLRTSHSDSLQAMLRFFDTHQLSPYESLGNNMDTLERRLKKRMNAMIAIIKDIEKRQTKPTQAMLQLLFEQVAATDENTPDIQERELFNPSSCKEIPELKVEKEAPSREVPEVSSWEIAYHSEQERSKMLYELYSAISSNVRYIKPGLGKNYFRLEMTPKQWEKIQQKIEYVYHHHTTETR